MQKAVEPDIAKIDAIQSEIKTIDEVIKIES